MIDLPGCRKVADAFYWVARVVVICVEEHEGVACRAGMQMLPDVPSAAGPAAHVARRMLGSGRPTGASLRALSTPSLTFVLCSAERRCGRAVFVALACGPDRTAAGSFADNRGTRDVCLLGSSARQSPGRRRRRPARSPRARTFAGRRMLGECLVSAGLGVLEGHSPLARRGITGSRHAGRRPGRRRTYAAVTQLQAAIA